MNILLIVTGGIAAYKACDIIGLLKREGHTVKVVMTTSAKAFITPLTLSVLSENEVFLDEAFGSHKVMHIELGKWADKILIAPATFNIIGKIANGLADDLASTIMAALPKEKKVVIAPAMNTNMWENPILKLNIQKIIDILGYGFIEPRSAILACGDLGKGALARPIDIVKAL